MAKKISTPDPLIWLHDESAKDLGLRPEDVIPSNFEGRYVFLHDKEEITDLRALQEQMKNKPGDRPIISVGPDGRTPTLLVQDREMEAEEVQDVLGETYEKNEKRLRQSKPMIDYDLVRYVNHMNPASAFSDTFKDALRDRIKRHKQNSISDPPRDPWKGLVGTSVVNPDHVWKKDAQPSQPSTEEA